MTAVNLNRAIRGPVTAVPVVAGKGVRIVPDTVNNRFVVEADETVLFSNQQSSTSQMSLSEAPSNFEYIEVYASWGYNNTQRMVAYAKIPGSASTFNLGSISVETLVNTGTGFFYCAVDYSISGSTITVNKAVRNTSSGSTPSTIDSLKIDKIIGINRISST